VYGLWRESSWSTLPIGIFVAVVLQGSAAASFVIGYAAVRVLFQMSRE
jgi:hypothetical protein